MQSLCRFALRTSAPRAAMPLAAPHAVPVRAMSVWADVPMGPKDPILGVTEAFKADTDPRKLNLGVGAYRDDNGKPTVLKSVQLAQEKLFREVMQVDNEYAPIAGQSGFVNAAVGLAYGKESAVVQENRVAACQTLSGTGALRVVGEMLNRFSKTAVYLPNPTWGNHIPIFKDSGLDVQRYRYYDPKTNGLDFNGVLEDVKNAPKGSAFLFHACAHNPTGVDPNPEQWKEISAAVKAAGHFTIIDMAYQGFASGDTVRDGQAIHTFLEDGNQIALSQSFAKNFGLYGQRCGAVSLLTDSADETARLLSQLKIMVRPIYSSPPLHGARVVETILNDDALYQQWKVDVKEMADRIISMRQLLYQGLQDAGSKHNWQHVIDQIGMFCYSGMTPQQVEQITNKHHVYLTSNGRISMAGVTSKNVGYLAEAIHDVTK